MGVPIELLERVQSLKGEKRYEFYQKLGINTLAHFQTFNFYSGSDYEKNVHRLLNEIEGVKKQHGSSSN